MGGPSNKTLPIYRDIPRVSRLFFVPETRTPFDNSFFKIPLTFFISCLQYMSMTSNVRFESPAASYWSGSPTDMYLDVRSKWVGEPDYLISMISFRCWFVLWSS